MNSIRKTLFYNRLMDHQVVPLDSVGGKILYDVIMSCSACTHMPPPIPLLAYSASPHVPEAAGVEYISKLPYDLI
jgi:hypothetical protein